MNVRQKCLFCFVCFALLTFILGAPITWSQSIVTGGIAGVVTDPTGAVVSDAKLTLKSISTGEVYTATSSTRGDFVFALLKPGEYSLSVTKEGFKTTTRNVTVVLGTTVPASVALEIGDSKTTIEVTAETGAQLQTENANIATNFGSKQIQEVPNPGGDITYVALSAPGVTMNSSTVGGFGNFSSFGLPATANLFTVNGTDLNDPFLNLNNSGSSNLLLGSNELQEVTVVSNAYTGQYGRQAGAQIDYTTISGTNSWHGDAIYSWTGRYLNANDPINKATSSPGQPLNPRPFENNNQWAARLSGPIVKNKAFFAVNTEGIRYIFGSIHRVFVPTPAFQSFALGNIPQDAATQAFYRNTFKLWNGAPGRPANPTQVAGSCSGNGLPATINGDQCIETWSDSVSSGNEEWLITGRVDYSITDKDTVYFRANVDRGKQPTYTDTINPTFNAFSTQPQYQGQVNYTHVFSPAVVNNFIGNYFYYSAIFGGLTSNDPALKLIPGNLIFGDGSLTNLGFGSGSPGGYGSSFFFPQGRNSSQWGLVDDLSVARGNHTLKMGMNFRRNDLSDHTASIQTVYPAVQTTLAGFASDQANVGVNYNFALTPVQPLAFYSLGLYFQDEFRATPKLKLTLTLRADRNSNGACQHHCAGFPAVPFPELAKGPDIPYNQSYLTGRVPILRSVEMVVFEPRFGVAWSPWGNKTVIRAGVGLFTDLYPGVILSPIDTNFPQVNLWNVPFSKTGTLAWDLQPLSSSAFPNSGVSIVQQCNTLFNHNYNSGGSFNTYQAAVNALAGSNPAFAGCLTTPTVNDVNSTFQNPKYVEWNFEIQRQLGKNTIVSLNYVGNRGYDELFYNNNLNGFGFGSLTATAAPDARVGRVNFASSGAVSNYNGLTVSVRENPWHGLSGQFNYTYSHALDEVSNGGNPFEPFSVTYSLAAQIDPFNLRNNYASADYDVRHQISGSYLYELPFKSQNRALNAAIGGWQVSGTIFWRGGFPFSVYDMATTNGLAANNLTGGVILLQPEFSKRDFPNVGSCVVNPCFGITGGVNGTPGQGNFVAPFLFQKATNFTNSVVGRNAFRGPGFLGGDMSVRKNFKLTERVTFQLGLNAYNWFNHANYGSPVPATNFGSAFGQVLFTQTPPTSPYGAFAAAATDMRMAQVMGKITF